MENLTLIIPAKFESESLPKVLKELQLYKCKKLIVLDKEDTKTISSINEITGINILYQNKKGYGAALIEGIKNCSTDFFCIFNADGSFNPKELICMYKQLETCDFVFGSRYQINAGSDDDTIITKIGNFFFSKIGQIFFKLPITDILYTFVMGKTAKAKLLELTMLDFSYCVELPIKAHKNNMELKSVPSFERKRTAGKKKVNAIKDGFLILKSLFFLYFAK
jgi:glycosyltransferase involved in cell wall biosynthesis